MVYETVWFFFALGIAIFLSIGLLGLLFSPAIPGRTLKEVAAILSVLIIFAGAYFSYKWYSEKKGIQGMTQQVEEALHKYLSSNKLEKEEKK
ncbi:MAG: hypothetical protein OEW45_17115 [Deltaproteobacteria bacterium]|nr:hypothetical protein [Deltaproteobacteria bacterium]